MCAIPQPTVPRPGPVPLEGERRIITALLADVKGSTSMAEQIDVEVWVEIMNRVFQVLGSEIYRYGGEIDQYRGDGLGANKAMVQCPGCGEFHEAAKTCPQCPTTEGDVAASDTPEETEFVFIDPEKLTPEQTERLIHGSASAEDIDGFRKVLESAGLWDKRASVLAKHGVQVNFQTKTTNLTQAQLHDLASKIIAE